LEALSRVSFELADGEMAFLTGHSGAGKSTLMKLIILMERASQGQVIVNGTNLNRVSRRQVPAVRRNVGVVFQNHQLLFDRTVYDNVALPLTIAGFSPKEVGRRVRAALSKVGLSNKDKKHPVALSGGEQQRVGIARAVVNKPPLLLADEPTGNLDPELSQEIMDLFSQFNQVGVSVLIATHDLDLVQRMAKRELLLRQGKVVSSVIA
jgi:cell division transport system ATP-binding protein